MTGGSERSHELDEYLAERIRQAFATDPRVSELELQVTLAGPSVFVSGTVSTSERQRAVTEVVREIAPDREVHNQTRVVPTGPEAGVEELT
jgi:osmotically-inducible protein OsmY